MREHFEKAEKIALRSSKTYKVKIWMFSTLTYRGNEDMKLHLAIHFNTLMLFYQAIHKNKREKALEINELAKKGGGESYIDSSRGIAVGMGK